MPGQPVPIHGPDHGPDGPDPIDIPGLAIKLFSYNTTTTQVIPSSTTATTLTFDQAGGVWGGDFDVVGNTAGAHVPATTSTQEWFIYEGGLFMVGFDVVWETGNYAKRTRIRHRFGSGGGTQAPFYAAHGTWGDVAGTFVAQNAFDTSLSTPHSMWDMTIFRPDLQTNPRVAVEATQTSGSNKNITHLSLTLVRLAVVGEYSST